ncbi:uncharacterized protein LOC131937005 isoform X2 [Physella acuta]|uniref:uncharacterized protein LOC131937005 isoform X2 n=1 Tax=Physella acuta TaxID=109671 RepID=UPI0027DDA57C|nr:uncharacterized protein LOC131937005 isoform X2 [Physella acuta]
MKSIFIAVFLLAAIVLCKGSPDFQRYCSSCRPEDDFCNLMCKGKQPKEPAATIVKRQTKCSQCHKLDTYCRNACVFHMNGCLQICQQWRSWDMNCPVKCRREFSTSR